jgi:hypothetical protein
MFVKLAKESNQGKGNELDHFWAAVLLEKFDTALTATARKGIYFRFGLVFLLDFFYFSRLFEKELFNNTFFRFLI